MKHVFAGDYGFSIDFASEVDLSSMTHVRMVIRQPGGTLVRYDFPPEEFAGVVPGGTLSYLVRAGDLPRHGTYVFQVGAKDQISDLAFSQWELEAKQRNAPDFWA